MRVSPGQLAPSLRTEDIAGYPVSLDTYRGQPVLLSFVRFAGCPFCNLHIYALTVRHPVYAAAGLATIAVVESTRAHILTQPLLRDAPFPIIADPTGHLYAAYGAESRRWGFWRALRRRAAEVTHAQQNGWDGLVDGKPRDNDGNLYRLPAEFLIGPDQTIQVAHYGQDIGDFLPLSTLDQALHIPAIPVFP